MLSEPVTVMVARQVAPGREIEFESWADELTLAASRCTGFLCAGLLKPAKAGDAWQVIYRFDTDQHLAQWESSPGRETLLHRADELMETVGVHRVTGLETWFALPGRTAPAPPRWKMFITSAACIYGLQVLVYTGLGGLVRQWPLGARLLLTVSCVTALMTWLVMPQVTRVLSGWLYPNIFGVTK
jgi:uncharacterized protein